MPRSTSFLVLLLLLVVPQLANRLAAQRASIGYDFDRPELVSNLPNELDEISGLGVSTDRANELLAVEDEHGKVYRLNGETGGLLWAIDFWKDGDYEGVEAVGDDVWVVKSTGTLYQISRVGQPDQEVKKYNTLLTGDNDVEGLAYDPARQRLLLACKRDADDDGRPKNARYIFAFDLATKTLAERPVITIEREAVTRFLARSERSDDYAKLCAFFNERPEYDLAPSALAIHPKTAQLFLISSVGKVLMVVDPDGTISHLRRLPKSRFPQPEGIAFAADGTLYLSTEAKGGQPARLYRLAYAK